MRVSIFGLGYVGCVSAGCLAKNGHTVIGVDMDPHKVSLINQGKPTIIEKDIDALISEGQDSGELRATTDTRDAILNTDISIVCVGTPSGEDGSLDLSFIYRVAAQIGQGLKEKSTFHVVAIRSTVSPGTCRQVATIIGEESGKTENTDFAIVSNPEFLREGTAVNDYFNPPYTLLGSNCEPALDLMAALYANVNGELYKTELGVAEIIKYINNSFHALKITFANEVGNICKALDIDSHKVMDLFCKDTHLNISPYYLKPGFAYGGSCLPKDLKALSALANRLNIQTPVLNGIQPSNELQKERLVKELIKTGKKRLGVLGLSFKAGTDDLRESPIVDVIERMLGKGYDIKIHDEHVQLSRLTGANKSYIENKLPHLSNLLASLREVLEHAEILVIANKEPLYQQLFSQDTHTTGTEELSQFLNGQLVVDLVRLPNAEKHSGGYLGLAW